MPGPDLRSLYNTLLKQAGPQGGVYKQDAEGNAMPVKYFQPENEDGYIGQSEDSKLPTTDIEAQKPNWMKYESDFDAQNKGPKYDRNLNNPLMRKSKKLSLKNEAERVYGEDRSNYIAQQLLAANPQGDRDRVSWMNSFNPTEREKILSSGEGYQLQPSDFASAQAGATSHLNYLTGMELQSPYVTKEEQEQRGALNVFDVANVPGKVVRSIYRDQSIADALQGKQADERNVGFIERGLTDLVGDALVGGAGKILQSKNMLKGFSFFNNKKNYQSLGLNSGDNIDISFKQPDIYEAQNNKYIIPDFKKIRAGYPDGKISKEEVINYFDLQPDSKHADEITESINSNYFGEKDASNIKQHNYKIKEMNDVRSAINNKLYGNRNSLASNIYGSKLSTLRGLAVPLGGVAAWKSIPVAYRKALFRKVGLDIQYGENESSKGIDLDLDEYDLSHKDINDFDQKKYKDYQYILGNDFIEVKNNSVRTAKEWKSINDNDTYSDKNYSSKGIESFYGIENGKFKVGKKEDFNDETKIVPNRFNNSLAKSEVKDGRLKLYDQNQNLIYHNLAKTGKFILHSPSSKKSVFMFNENSNETSNKINNFIIKNKDAQFIHIDNGRYTNYFNNKEGLNDEDFKSYREMGGFIPRGNAKLNLGYQIIAKKKLDLKK